MLTKKPNNLELINEYKKLIDQANGAETDWIDFKLEVFNNKNKQDKKIQNDDLRSDVVSFGNHKGGILLIGVKEDHKTLEGFELKHSSIDELILDIRNTLSSKIFPSMPKYKEESIEIDHISLENKKYAMRITIKEFNQLRVVQLSDKKFVIPCRQGNRTEFLDLGEIDYIFRRKYELAEETQEKAKSYVQSRLNFIRQIIYSTQPNRPPHTQNVDFLLPPIGIAVMHVMPREYLRNPTLFSQEYKAENISGNPEGALSIDSHINENGKYIYATVKNTKISDKFLTHSYSFCSEEGYLEFLTLVNTGSNNSAIVPYHLEHFFIKMLQGYLEKFEEKIVRYPLIISFNLINIQNHNFIVDKIKYGTLNKKWSEELLSNIHDLPFNFIIVPDDKKSAEEICKPFFDKVWRLFGFKECHHYNERGQWNP